jgi:hypothetical protein
MPDAQISPAAAAPAVVVNSRDTRIMGVHPQQGHTTNGGAVKIGGDQVVRATMGASGARVAAPNGLPTGTPKAQTGAAISHPAPAGATAAKPATTTKGRIDGKTDDAALTAAEAALALDIVEGQVTQVIIMNAAPSAILVLAKDVVRKLRAQAGIPTTVPLPWDLAPAQVSSAAPVPVPVSVPVTVPVTVPDLALTPVAPTQVDVGSAK